MQAWYSSLPLRTASNIHCTMRCLLPLRVGYKTDYPGLKIPGGGGPGSCLLVLVSLHSPRRRPTFLLQNTVAAGEGYGRHKQTMNN